MADKRLIVALDFPDFESARACVEEIGDAVDFYKVGMELYYACGSRVIEYLKNQGKSVFLDLKLHDIPNTVASALAVLTRQGGDILNVHATGGFKMMQAASLSVKDAAQKAGIPCPKLIAVTVLTSMDEEELTRIGINATAKDAVVKLARLAKEAGMDGVVASAQEASMIANACGKDFLIVTPGIRPAGSAAGDQSRITTPAQAFTNGATHIVVGRPITRAQDKREAARAISEEIARC